MSARRQIIFYDQRGTGKSPSATGERDLTGDATVRDLEALRQKLKLDRAAPGSGKKRGEFGKQKSGPFFLRTVHARQRADRQRDGGGKSGSGRVGHGGRR